MEEQNRQDEQTLNDYLGRIVPADREAMRLAKKRWNSVAKPIGSLGILEEDIIRIAGMTGNAFRVSLEKSALAVMCADHGVCAEGVTQTGQEITRLVAENFTKNKTSVTIMCQVSHTDVFPVDIGMLGDRALHTEPEPFVLLDRKIACGTGNLAREAAMERAQCVRAILSGIRLAGDLAAMGYQIIATGEMGIGNTTPSSALAAVLTGQPPETMTGRGAGLSDAGLARKREVISMAVRRFKACRPEISEKDWLQNADTGSILTLFSELGGFDLAGLTGVFLGGAVFRVPVIIDGFISSVAALLAVLLCPAARDYLLASHVSSEPAGQRVMDAIGLPAPLNCGMHLGEGSGAIAFLPLLQMGAAVYEKMSTFSEIQMEDYVDYEAEKEDGRCGRL